MSSLCKRLTALLLCLCLFLPCLAQAENARAVRFRLEAEMFPDAYPKNDQPLAMGLSELVNMLSLEGVFQYDEDCIDLDAAVLLDHAEDTRTAVHIYGNEAYWGVESSLFGEHGLYLNLQALLEFCMKAYYHLDVPLQRVGLFVTPYVHTNGLGTITALWNRFMNVQTGSRTVARDEVLTMAQHISTAAATDRAFTYWVRALALESGYDNAIHDFVDQLPAWIEGFLGDEGVTITVEDENETWSAGGLTLYSRTVKDGWTTQSFALPESLDGYVLSGFSTTQDNGDTLNADIRLTASHYGENILDIRFAADNLPQKISASGDFSMSCTMTGAAVPSELRFLAEGFSENGVFTIHQKNPVTKATMLTISGVSALTEVTASLDWTRADLPSLEFFSLSDVTLSQFVSDVRTPMIKGLLPLLSHAPIAACQTLMDLVMDAGIFDVLTSSASSIEDEDSDFYADEESWDEESWDEESWDEESWDEESWDEESWDDDSLYE